MYNLAHFLSHLRRSGTDLVLDIGANAGQFASEMFNAGFTGKVLSFEPLSSAHEVLRETARGNPKWEVAPRCALGATAGTVVINIAGNSFSSSLRPMLKSHLEAAPESAYVGTESTPMETLANIITRRFPEGIRRFALKIDTQGFESDVLDGLGGHIEQCSAILLEMPLDSLYGGASDLPTLFSRLIGLNFRCVGMSPGHANLQTGDAVEVDGLFVRDVSAPSQSFPLLTSIPPHLSGDSLARQQAIIASWRAAGFDPVSVNGPSEIGQLKDLDLAIAIEPAPEDGKPFIGDIIAAIRKRECACAGIINADCKLIGYPSLSLRLAAALPGRVLYAERVDVDDDRVPTMGECNGFDAFFFDVSMAGAVSDRRFRLGETWWDYWFPLQLFANGAALGNIDVPLVYHRRHDARWDREQWVRHAHHMSTSLKTWSAKGIALPFLDSPDDLADSRLSDLHHLSTIGAACFQWLRSRRLPRETLFLSDGMSSIEGVLRDARRSFLNGGVLVATEAELAAVKAELAAFKLSTTWRITAPLRYLVDLVRGNTRRAISVATSN